LLWSRLRQALQRGTPEQRAVGAWTWVRLRRARHRRPLPINASPDVAAGWAKSQGDDALALVAQSAAAVAFNPGAQVPESAAVDAWQAAIEAARAPSDATLRQRWAWSRRLPRSVRAELTRGRESRPRP
jgi:hypothetical protein